MEQDGELAESGIVVVKGVTSLDVDQLVGLEFGLATVVSLGLTVTMML